MQLDRWWHRFAVILRTARKRDGMQHVAVLPSYYPRYFSFCFFLIKSRISLTFFAYF